MVLCINVECEISTRVNLLILGKEPCERKGSYQNNNYWFEKAGHQANFIITIEVKATEMQLNDFSIQKTRRELENVVFITANR
jgi:hypothetical protein